METCIGPLSVVGPLPWPDDRQPPRAQTLPQMIEDRAAEQPEALALLAGERRLTYRQLQERVELAARAFTALGVDHGSRVGILATNVEEWIVATYGALRAGAVVDAFNTWVKSYDLDHLLTASGVEFLVMVPGVKGEELLGELTALVPEVEQTEPGALSSAGYPRLSRVVVLGDWEPRGATDSFDVLMSDAPALPESVDRSRGEDAALVLYTSGTTSKPKAVPLAHRAMIENGFAIGSRMALTPSDRVWLGSPLFWSYGCVNAAIATFSNGACLVLQGRFTPVEAAELIRDEGCTAAYLLPSIVTSLVEQVGEEIRASALRTGLIIGRPEELQLAVEGLDVPELCNVYGSTEVYGNCCVTESSMPLEQRLICQGQPLPGVAIRAFDEEDERVCEIGEIGEFQVRGRVMTGYIGDEESTRAAFTSDGWFRTGDTGLVREDGTVQFASRATDMIKTSGINVSPAEVESFLDGHPDVVEVGVVGAPHPSREEVTVAFVVLRPGATITGAELRDYCKSALAGYKVPWAVELTDALPKTGTGKMMRRELREPAARIVEAELAEGAR